MEAVAKIKTLSLLDIEPQLLGHPAHGPLYKEIRGLLEKYPTFGREKETGLLGALDT